MDVRSSTVERRHRSRPGQTRPPSA